MKRKLRFLALLLCLILLLPLLPAASNAAGEDVEEELNPNGKETILISLGDSYSSGEGVPPFTGQSKSTKDKLADEAYLAHQSENSYASQLRLPGLSGTMKDNKGTNWYCAYSSGATTENVRRTGSTVVDPKTGRLEGQQAKNYDREGFEGTYNLPGQLDVFYTTPGLDRKEVDYVTMTIGGNDVGFDNIIEKAVTGGKNSTKTYDAIKKELDHFYDPGGTYDKLKATYERIEDAAPNATILIAGYPPLVETTGKKSWCFNEYEARDINAGVAEFNRRIEELIRDCQYRGMKIEFVDVAPAFKGHEAYSDDPYINPIIMGAEEEDLKYNFTAWNRPLNTPVSPYSMHPNAKGVEAYAKCFQNKLDEIEARKRKEMPPRETSTRQNIVLVLDNSGSMEGAPIQQTREAAKNFVDTVLSGDASVAVVSFATTARIRSDFNRNADYLKSAIDSISADDMTNTEGGLSLAASMLSGAGYGKKIIMLMSDGQANVGRTGADLMRYIDALKDQGYYFYTLGFFEDLSGSDLNDAQGSMENIASPGCHYEVEDAEQLVGSFSDIAEQVNGQSYTYVRIECPVDVEVTLGDETLSSVTDSTRTTFGTLSFEAGTGDGDGTDNRTKILRLLDDGTDYQIRISGNGSGTMNYTAGFMDRSGEYTDLREIKDVPITPDTVINANAKRYAATVLELDRDGDGTVDQTFREGGPLVNPQILMLAGGLLILLILLILILRGRKRRKQMKAERAKAPAPIRPQPKPIPVNLGSPQAASGIVFCSSCGARQNAGAQFCSGCGAQLRPKASADVPYCRNCGAKLKEGASFCGSCGAKQQPGSPQEFKYCRNCGAKVNQTAAFCETCGSRL